MHRVEPRHHPRQRGRDPRVGRVRNMLQAVAQVIVHLRVECVAKLPGRGRNVDRQPALRDSVHRNAVRSQPTCHSVDVLLRRAVIP